MNQRERNECLLYSEWTRGHKTRSFKNSKYLEGIWEEKTLLILHLYGVLQCISTCLVHSRYSASYWVNDWVSDLCCPLKQPIFLWLPWGQGALVHHHHHLHWQWSHWVVQSGYTVYTVVYANGLCDPHDPTGVQHGWWGSHLIQRVDICWLNKLLTEKASRKARQRLLSIHPLTYARSVGWLSAINKHIHFTGKERDIKWLPQNTHLGIGRGRCGTQASPISAFLLQHTVSL